MRYERETPSRFAPPPGYCRTVEGLVRIDSDTKTAAPPSETEPQLKLPQTPLESADTVRNNSGSTPAEAKDQVEVEVQGKDQGKSKEKDNHHHQQQAQSAT